MPAQRWLFSTSVVGDKIYIIGGWGYTIPEDQTWGNPMPSVWIYETFSDKWTIKGTEYLPTPRNRLSTNIVNGKIYAIGGMGFQLLFSIGMEYQTDLDKGIISEALRQEFNKHGVSLSKESRISREDTLGGWVVLSGDLGQLYNFNNYRIVKYDDHLNVHINHTNVLLRTVEVYDTGTKADDYGQQVAIRIHAISLHDGNISGGDKITIFGSGFPLESVVTIGGNLIDQVKITDTLITGITPPGTEGNKEIWITAPGMNYHLYLGDFIYKMTTSIIIKKMIPDNGRQAGGEIGCISGDEFLPGATVTIGGIEATNVIVTATLIIFIIPPGTEGAKDVVITYPDGQKGTLITAITPSRKPGKCDITIINPDGQRMTLPDGFTYNPMPVITRITPDHGLSSGGTRITIEGSGFLIGVRVAIGDKQAIAQLKDSMTIEAVTPSNQQGVWDVRVINPDTQEVVKPRGFITVGVLAYNYPNPFRMSQGTTFRYISNESVQSITVKIFNFAGVPIDIVHQDNAKEVRWQNEEVHVGMYIYIMIIKFSNGETRQFKKTLEVYK